MANVRWNFRLGPLQLTSPFGVISAAVVGGLLVLCCCAGAIGAVSDSDDELSRPVVNASVIASSAPPSTPAQQVAPSPTKSTVVKVSPTPKRTTAAPKPKPSPTRKPPPAPKTDPRFGTCGEANDNGYGPYVEGEDPEYDWYQDRDGDGIVCERG